MEDEEAGRDLIRGLTDHLLATYARKSAWVNAACSIP